MASCAFCQWVVQVREEFTRSADTLVREEPESEETVSIDLTRYNAEGRIRWYPNPDYSNDRGMCVGVVVALAPDSAVQGYLALDRGQESPWLEMSATKRAVGLLAMYQLLSHEIEFVSGAPPDESMCCTHHDDIQEPLHLRLGGASTNELAKLIASRR